MPINRPPRNSDLLLPRNPKSPRHQRTCPPPRSDTSAAHPGQSRSATCPAAVLPRRGPRAQPGPPRARSRSPPPAPRRRLPSAAPPRGIAGPAGASRRHPAPVLLRRTAAPRRLVLRREQLRRASSHLLRPPSPPSPVTPPSPANMNPGDDLRLRAPDLDLKISQG